ncbi:hypothetical protein KDL01_06035 [Actinospica durhamensis]|uniref:Uncharacterized protein n=1 Tax=Actinospica durhamensis TaxID=1508375 RepID=A0A941IS20_9ACTN|nr:hypothetical protein [Actinospica durhamensis]MBR7832811.1 hypothetical protein [Actinospica durhamensis]
MARTYLSTLSPRRRWGIASAAAGTALALTAGLGNPWSYSTISALPKDAGANKVPLLAGTLQVFHWTTGANALGGSSAWTAALVLDAVWPLLILAGARALAGGLALRRAKLSLIVGVWAVATLTGAFAGLIAGLVDHHVGAGAQLREAFVTVTAQTRPGDILTLQAATMALVGALIGWLPGCAAAIAYAVKRAEPAEAERGGRSGEERTLTEVSTEPGSTLSLENLEELRRVRREGGPMKDARTSEFFKV